jgi:hypothetical protein
MTRTDSKSIEEQIADLVAEHHKFRDLAENNKFGDLAEHAKFGDLAAKFGDLVTKFGDLRVGELGALTGLVKATQAIAEARAYADQLEQLQAIVDEAAGEQLQRLVQKLQTALAEAEEHLRTTGTTSKKARAVSSTGAREVHIHLHVGD